MNIIEPVKHVGQSHMQTQCVTIVDRVVSTLKSTDWPTADISVRPQHCSLISNIAEHEPLDKLCL